MKQLLIWLIFSIFLFSISLIFVVIFIISSLGSVYSSFSNFLRHSVRLLRIFLASSHGVYHYAVPSENFFYCIPYISVHCVPFLFASRKSFIYPSLSLLLFDYHFLEMTSSISSLSAYVCL